MLKKCTCKSEFQDRRYGVGMRLHTIAKPGAIPQERCTICFSNDNTLAAMRRRADMHARGWNPMHSNPSDASSR